MGTTPISVCVFHKNLIFQDYSSIYLSDIKSFTNSPPASTTNDNSPKCSILENQNELNLLAIGTSTGHVHLYVFGTLPLASINLNNHLGEACYISQMHFSNNLDLMYVTVHSGQNGLKVVVIDSFLLKSHGKELYAIASKHEHLKALIDHLFSTITTIKENWENILLEMDTKLSKYAAKVPQGGITADFLDLLMFGTYSSDIEEFLVHDLTKKGLEKFGHTIEMSYGSIQKLLIKYVSKMGQNITYHLAELRGLARLAHRFGVSIQIIASAMAKFLFNLELVFQYEVKCNYFCFKHKLNFHSILKSHFYFHFTLILMSRSFQLNQVFELK